MSKKRGLGRGLENYFGNTAALATGDAGTTAIALGDLQPGHYQPRKDFSPEALEDLAASIRTQGVMQPILVRPLPPGRGARYEIIAGERRFRASQMAGLSEIPALVREVDDQKALAMALIENLQREDLSALEEAEGIERLIQEFGLTHEQAAEAVGRSRSATSNLLRLLGLPAPTREALREGRIDAGHARALLALPEALHTPLLQSIAAEGLSVREVENRVRDWLAKTGGQDGGRTTARGAGGKSSGSAGSGGSSADWGRMERLLADQLGLSVRLRAKASGGELTIRFGSVEEFEGLRQRLLPQDTDTL